MIIVKEREISFRQISKVSFDLLKTSSLWLEKKNPSVRNIGMLRLKTVVFGGEKRLLNTAGKLAFW